MCWPCSHISENIFSLHSLETKDESSFLRAVNFFLTELATRDLSAAESCFPHGGRTSHFSPSEVEQYNYSKCTIIVRLLEFATMILVKGGQEFWKVSPNCLAFWLENQITIPLSIIFAYLLFLYPQLLEQDIFGPVFFELTAMVVCEPSSVGFNIADVEVMKKLPEVCVPLLKALLASQYCTRLECSMRTRISRKRYAGHLLVPYIKHEQKIQLKQLSETILIMDT